MTTVDNDLLVATLDRLKLTAIRDQLDSLLDEAARSKMTLREALAFLVSREIARRDERRISMSSKTAQSQRPEVPHVREKRCISGAVEPHRGADQCRSDPRSLGRSAPPRRVDHDAVRGAVYDLEEAVRISKAKPSGEGAPRTRSD